MSAVAGAGPEAANSTPDAPRPANIAVVDDDSGFAGYLRTFLALRGYEARSYTRGDEIVVDVSATEKDKLEFRVLSPTPTPQA